MTLTINDTTMTSDHNARGSRLNSQAQHRNQQNWPRSAMPARTDADVP